MSIIGEICPLNLFQLSVQELFLTNRITSTKKLYKARTGPRSATRSKPEVHPLKCSPEVHPSSKLTMCPEQGEE